MKRKASKGKGKKKVRKGIKDLPLETSKVDIRRVRGGAVSSEDTDLKYLK